MYTFDLLTPTGQSSRHAPAVMSNYSESGAIWCMMCSNIISTTLYPDQNLRLNVYNNMASE